ncbi:SLC13 family permease [Burkholderia pseudomultivorans]|uniref:Citrate transporter n=1 Tax=Burkholderia pseudomultivorans TaxID=1207504 RepID=A0A6P2N1C7_9BURK|nr:SLC13 family permease [Burkholderia pseudomultivorans]MDR8732109.1 Inner membrane protein YbiR [Burkholderia pseudomultivorans]MDR8737569.1 Inner membrane protein YbiR [Burkholderia pseudomultivorans]MDR8743906.1 Inner membrane protein YbiR [Burkholderia pseudomultivorans]MDR8755164.1 Inner membrane protein YbiR [Burkholderia pseudomultivorans]MDR8780289.1 Inner membrane protein YbiR [Burkholderia pseudomultivorans]
MDDTGAPAPRRWLGWLAQEPVLSVLVLGLIALQWMRPQPFGVLAGRVDWQTVATLAGLLMLTKALELSGCLMWLAHRIVHHVHSERGLAMLLVVFAAALSMWLTNDVALFVVVPLMVSLRALTPLPFRRLVIVVALAVNAGSVATPLGNPQNLFLWQLSGVSFGRFVVTLGPLAAALMALLLVLTACMFRAKPLDLSGDVAARPVQRMHALIAAVMFAAFVLLADAHHPLPGLIAVAIVLLVVQRQAVLKIDWLLLLIFVLMFVVLRSAAALPVVHDAIARAQLDSPLRVFAAGAVLSQGISNVPAAILLSEFTHDWRALAFGVSVGGFGFAIGSLANLIAVRLAKEPRMWLPFHLLSIPFALASAALGAWLLHG